MPLGNAGARDTLDRWDRLRIRLEDVEGPVDLTANVSPDAATRAAAVSGEVESPKPARQPGKQRSDRADDRECDIARRRPDIAAPFGEQQIDFRRPAADALDQGQPLDRFEMILLGVRSAERIAAPPLDGAHHSDVPRRCEQRPGRVPTHVKIDVEGAEAGAGGRLNCNCEPQRHRDTEIFFFSVPLCLCGKSNFPYGTEFLMPSVHAIVR